MRLKTAEQNRVGSKESKTFERKYIPQRDLSR
jgi:hypothetical protein